MTSSTLSNAEPVDAWAEYTSTGRISNQTNIRPEILNSWKRSRSFSVDHRKRINSDQLTTKELTRRRKINEELLTIAEPIMKNLYDIVERTDFVIALSDAQGYLLEVVGTPQKKLGEITNLFVGSCWSEETMGTNGFSLALATGRPVQVIGAEHFCRISHYATCSASPIFNPENEIIAILDMTGRKELVHAHTLGMVVAAADAITDELQLKRLHFQKDLIFGSLNEAILLLDSLGRIAYFNPASCSILKLQKEQLYGRTFEDLFYDSKTKMITNERIKHIFEKDEDISDQLIEIQQGNYLLKCSVTIKHLFPDDSQKKEKVVIFSERKRIRQIMKNFAGTTAHITFSDIVGHAPCFQECIELAEKISISDSSVLLTGESGTGKEMFAQAIHNKSHRKSQPFVAINCGAIPRELMASELFGFEEGSFTGAKKGGNIGKFELADGGTLFLDEIGELPLDLQVMLLRVLEQKAIVRIGAKNLIPINVRIIAATNKNLGEQITTGDFRSDLFYRLNVINIKLPPLRERMEDLPALINKITSRFTNNPIKIDPNVLELILNYDWPGNIRELQNVIEHAMAVNGYGSITVSSLPKSIVSSINFEHNERKDIEKIVPLKDLENEAILSAVRACNFNFSLAAKCLGINRSTIYRKLGISDTDDIRKNFR